MFDQYLIDEHSIHNVGPADAPTGFCFASKIGYYRGLGLSMIEDLEVSIDGETLPRDAISFDEGHGPLSLDDMETAFDRRWNFGAPATIYVSRPGGFPEGEHRVSLRQKLRISYLPFPSFNFVEKMVTVPR